jgi:tetratricopeptide (TPR) repeat protein
MLVGQILQERYHLIAQISHNEFQATYLALDGSAPANSAAAKYIIKHFPALQQETAHSLAIAAQIQEFNHISDRFPPLQDYWLYQNQLFLAYQYIDNQALATELIPKKMWPEKFVIGVIAEIMEVLQPLHQQGFGHGNLQLSQLARREPDRQIILTDTGLVRLTMVPTQIDEGQLIQQDLQAIGHLAIQLLTGVKIKQLIDAQGHLAWRKRTNCGDEFATIIDQLITNDPAQKWSTVLPAWLKLSQIMNRILTQRQISDPQLMTDPNSLDISQLKKQADQKFLKGDAAGSIADYSKLIELDPQAFHYHNRGIIYAHELQDYEHALQDYNQTLSLKPDFPSAHQNRANVHRWMGNLSAALDDYNHCIQLLPNLAVIYWERGLTHQKMGNLTAAIDDYSKFLSYQPYHDLAYYQRGNVYQQLGNPAAALADYDRAIQINPQSAKAHYNRGTFHYQQADLNAALTNYSQAIELDPRMAIAYQQRGWIYQQQGDLVNALADYQQASNLAPSADIYHQTGLLNSELGNLDAALTDYNQALAINPQMVKTYNNRGIIKRRQGDLLGAMNDYGQGLSIEPESLDCLRNRGIARQELKDYAGAISDYRRAANLHLSHGQQPEYEKVLTMINTLQRYC